MKIGVSSYSLYKAMRDDGMTILEAMEWIKENGAEHVEIVPLGFDLVKTPSLIEDIRNKAEELDLEISNYAIGANFIQESIEKVNEEIKRVKQHVDIANQLGARLMRHDAASRPMEETGIEQFYGDLPILVDACREIADYASQYGITTSVENHGYYLQSSERVEILVKLVNRPNFKTTLDVGNFLCVDEVPEAAVKNNLPISSMVHLKDFYYRPAAEDPGEGFFSTRNGNFLKGAILGQGDINIRNVFRLIKNSAYKGFLSLEFEGMEDCKIATKIGLQNIKRIWEEV
ncbi:sugar phosphate isomerase/epimerase [Falsibacillus pallidus]|uniref:Sugar phosphate isomerase/epimerase n=2 Tax=Falsibacillus pallidus TaxID=493781 RepID=A0A370GDG0_9BACI|nr:sugar phosphate isomerase/epimerase family protein [Falsibacillus pallidus]RDI40013.1 sugar phosphate isomerase/epimerase [Falsibacillus pallidus]